MKRYVSVFVVVLLAVSLFAACGDSSAPPSPESAPGESDAPSSSASEPESAGGGVELVIYTLNTGDKLEGMEKLVTEPFAAEHGVTFKINSVPSDQYMQVLMPAIQGGAQIDLLNPNGQDVRFMVNSGLLLELNEQGVDYQDRFTDFSAKMYEYEGKWFAVPVHTCSSSGIYYNKKVLEDAGLDPPETYGDLVNIAAALQPEGIAAIANGLGQKYNLPHFFFECFDQTSGHRALEATIETLTGNMLFTDDAYVEAFQVLYDMGQVPNMFQAGASGVDQDGGRALFAQGLGAMFISGSWEIPAFRQALGEDLDIVQFPRVSDKATVIGDCGGGGDPLALYKGISDENKVVALQLMDFWSSDEVNRQIMEWEKGGISPNRNVTADSDPIAQKMSETFFQETFIFLDWYWPPEITTVVQDNLLLLFAGGITPEEMAQQVQDVFDELVANGYDYYSGVE